METEEYAVERVEDVRSVKGRKEYYLKWKGYPSSLNSWEPMDKLNCLQLIASFEESLKNKSLKKKKPVKASKAQLVEPNNNTSKEDVNDPEENELKPVETILQPLKILGATDSSGELMFLIQWKDTDRADMVAAKVANIQCPQIVIKFYEEHLIWHSPN